MNNEVRTPLYNDRRHPAQEHWRAMFFEITKIVFANNALEPKIEPTISSASTRHAVRAVIINDVWQGAWR
jgi:hypothetical protein